MKWIIVILRLLAIWIARSLLRHELRRRMTTKITKAGVRCDFMPTRWTDTCHLEFQWWWPPMIAFVCDGCEAGHRSLTLSRFGLRLTRVDL